MADDILKDAEFMMALLLNRHYKGNHKEGIPVYHASNPEVPLCYTPKMTPKESTRVSRFSVSQKVESRFSMPHLGSSRFSMPYQDPFAEYPLDFDASGASRFLSIDYAAAQSHMKCCFGHPLRYAPRSACGASLAEEKCSICAASIASPSARGAECKACNTTVCDQCIGNGGNDIQARLYIQNLRDHLLMQNVLNGEDPIIMKDKADFLRQNFKKITDIILQCNRVRLSRDMLHLVDTCFAC